MDHNDIFEKMPVPKAYFTTALPVVLSMVVSLVYNMVDTWFIAGTQNTALVAGVSLCAPLFTVMVAFGDIFGLGGSSLISRLFGQKKEEDAKKICSFCFYGAIIFGIAVTVIMLALKTPILHALGAASDTIDYAASYYTWLVIGAPAIILALVPNNILRCEGLATFAMIGTITGSIVNIILDPVFIYLLGMGAGGAALATVLSNVVSDIIFIVIILKKSQKLSIHPKYFKIPAARILDILVIGFPASINNLMMSLGTIITNRFLISYGTDKIAALGIALKVQSVIILVLVGFAFGAQPLLGYNYGSGSKERLKAFIRFDLIVELTIAVFSAVVFALFAPSIIRIFMTDAAVIEAGSLMLRCLMITTPVVGIYLVFTTVFQSAGKALPALVLSVSRQGAVLILCLFILSAVSGYYGIILSQAAADVITLLIGIFCFTRQKDLI